jgi:CheY-like chemotaxis protein
VRRALIVDDEEYNRVVAAGLARELGYEPLMAANAAEALEIARRHTFEIVFIDLELPRTKGDELARELRRLPHGEGPLFIAMTGQDSEAARLRCREAGMDGFVLKPFDAGEVRELITRLSRTRAFELYARGAGESVEFALERFLRALDEETGHLGAAFKADDRSALAGAAHRLRTLAALGAARSLNALSARLQECAATLAAAELQMLVDEILGEARTLKAELGGHARR